MKKIGLSLLALCGVFALSGCNFNSEISDEEGKAWAIENGYEKKESNLGEYEFSHVIVKGESYDVTYITCPTSGSEDYDMLYETCQSLNGMKMNVKSDTSLEFVDNATTTTSNFAIDEEGYLHQVSSNVNAPKLQIRGKYLIKDNKVFMIGEDSTPTDGDYTYTIVFSKK